MRKHRVLWPLNALENIKMKMNACIVASASRLYVISCKYFQGVLCNVYAHSNTNIIFSTKNLFKCTSISVLYTTVHCDLFLFLFILSIKKRFFWYFLVFFPLFITVAVFRGKENMKIRTFHAYISLKMIVCVSTVVARMCYSVFRAVCIGVFLVEIFFFFWRNV